MPKSLVLIGDIKASRQMEVNERKEFQGKLEQILDKLNNEAVNLSSPYTITLGDEFQAVLRSSSNVFTHIFKIMGAVYPKRVRFSLVVGDIHTAINSKQAIGMDGPAFHEARRGIEKLKEREHLFNIAIEGENLREIQIINNSLQLLSGRMKKWNKRRLVILHMLKEGYNYKEISDTLRISQPAYYKNKEAGMLDVVDELSDNISVVINQRLEE